MHSGSAEKRWYLVHSKPRQEKVAKINLDRQGYVTYLPLLRTPRRRTGKRIIVIEPMFPRYFFIHLDTENDNWAPIRSTLGVSTLVRFGMMPTPIPDKLIDVLRSRDDSSGVQDIQMHTFNSGDHVRIEEGPFMGYEGIFLAETSQQRVLVLLDIAGKSARAHLDMEALGPVDD